VAATAIARVEAVEPVGVKLWITSRTRSSLVNVTSAIFGAGMPCADNSTTCARRHVTTDPDSRRTIRSSRFPSSLLISRTWTRSAIRPPGGSAEETKARLRSTQPKITHHDRRVTKLGEGFRKRP